MRIETKKKLHGLLYMTAAVITYALLHVTDKVGLEAGVDPFGFVFFRSLIGLLIVGAVWFAFRKKDKLKIHKGNIKELAIIGLLSGVLILIAIYALSFTTATIKGMMQGLFSASTAIFAFFILKERLSKLFYPLLAIMLFGLLLLTSNGLMIVPNKGDLLFFSIVPLVGFLNAFAKKTMSKNRYLTVAFGRAIFTMLLIAVVLLFTGPGKLLTAENGILWILLSGIFDGIRMIGFYKGMKMLGSTIAASMLAISPVITAIFAYFILDETLSFLQIGGLMLVLAAAFFIARIKSSDAFDKKEQELQQAHHLHA